MVGALRRIPVIFFFKSHRLLKPQRFGQRKRMKRVIDCDRRPDFLFSGAVFRISFWDQS
jgi:hypothetical protein